MSPRTFYPAADRITDATPITLAPGANMTGIDVTVRARAAHRVSGRVDGPPEAWDNLRLALVPADEPYVGTSSWLNVVWVENDGAFAFASVSPGSYLIVSSSWTHQDLLPSGLSGSDKPFTFRPWQLPSDNERRTTFSPYVVRQPIEIGGSDVADVKLPVRFRNEVSGRMIAAPGAIEAKRRIDAGTASLSAVPVGGIGNDGMRLVRSDTTFFVSDIFERQFFLRGDTPVTVMSVTVDGVDMTTRPMDLATGSNNRSIEVTLADISTLKGSIRDARGTARRAGVLYFPVERAEWDQFTSRSQGLGFAIAPSDGSYSTPIPGGRYFVVALPDSARNKWRNVEFLEAASKIATTVDVEWGATKTLDLQQRELEVKP
jgi:hypothetical protein